MDKLKDCKNYAGSLSLISTRENMETLLKGAEEHEKSYLEFLHGILGNEIKHRQDKARKKRIKEAGFPYIKKLEDFDTRFSRKLTP